MKVYAALYNPMIKESAWSTLSLHKTRKGAKMAMEFHREQERKEWEEHEKWQREEFGDMYEELKSSEFGTFEKWKVEEIEVLD